MRCAGVGCLLEVRDFVVTATGGPSIALPQLALAPGDVGAIHGPSGCGKSTLLAALFGLLSRPGWRATGHVASDGKALAARDGEERRRWLRHDVAFLPQDAHSALDPLQSVGVQLEQATTCSRDEGLAMLQRLGITEAADLWERRPHAISGGQAQRVLLAIAFLRRPRLVVADEPSASLDGGSYAELVAHLRELRQHGSAVLLATHDLRLLDDLAAKVWSFTDGAFVPATPGAAPWPRRSNQELGSLAVLAAYDVHHAFGSRRVLTGVDFQLRRGEVVAIVGESGAGKTTLVRILVGHLRPDAGSIERPERRTALQLVCQDAFGSLTPGVPLAHLLAEAKAPFFDAGAGMAAVRLPEALLRSPRERLSGGELRRAALLRALAVNPDVLVLDEPTASLDRATAVAVLETLMIQQRSRGLALVLVTHDHELARAVSHRVLLLQGGRLCPQAS